MREIVELFSRVKKEDFGDHCQNVRWLAGSEDGAVLYVIGRMTAVTIRYDEGAKRPDVILEPHRGDRISSILKNSEAEEEVQFLTTTFQWVEKNIPRGTSND